MCVYVVEQWSVKSDSSNNSNNNKPITEKKKMSEKAPIASESVCQVRAAGQVMRIVYFAEQHAHTHIHPFTLLVGVVGGLLSSVMDRTDFTIVFRKWVVVIREV